MLLRTFAVLVVFEFLTSLRLLSLPLHNGKQVRFYGCHLSAKADDPVDTDVGDCWMPRFRGARRPYLCCAPSLAALPPPRHTRHHAIETEG
jgi:hypothetical protein